MGLHKALRAGLSLSLDLYLLKGVLLGASTAGGAGRSGRGVMEVDPPTR